MIQTFPCIDCDDLNSTRVGGDPPASIDTSLCDEPTQFLGSFPLPSNTGLPFSIIHRFGSIGDDGCFGTPVYTQNKCGGLAYADRLQAVERFGSMPQHGFTHFLPIGQDGRIPDGFPWDPGCLNVWDADPLDPCTYRFCAQQ